ncbi:MAG TPA: DUF1707 domain-containing protein [Propioniciclava sp.]|jgi:hypothetical protein|uniref:DUF1707 SHOCT-like domain-containing protein n=1 Tax=Propioniciclava sp. TaxID=2038686 RepID=UPI002C312060|nr:DUF1707 domain-containing protein [Propioniciclava sp.]HRL49133.1 DUF1707 domain-containing protein [Propioniciclava sp.]HRL79362.1 DUF1707 domain-containing protein [Propioniciclava sp.]
MSDTSFNPPASRPGMRAGDSDRALVSDLLSAAYAEGRLSREEHDTRVAQAMNAKTFDDLRALTTDLVPSTNAGHAIGAFSSAGGPTVDRGPDGEGADTTFAIFGGLRRTGNWRARRHISNLTLFGGSHFDFRNATFSSDVVELTIICGFGGVDVLVPPGVNVRNETLALFGGTDLKRIEPVPGAPTVVLKGLVMFGGIDAKAPQQS